MARLSLLFHSKLQGDHMKKYLFTFVAVLTVVASAAMHDPKGGSGKNFDQSFLHKMTMHHEMGMPMLDMCTTKAVHAELKELCAQSKSDQQQQSQQMKSWMSGSAQSIDSSDHSKMKHADDKSMDHKGDKSMHPDGGVPGMQEMKQQREKMEQANGKEFEKIFLPAMAKHHQMAIKMSQPCPAKAERLELKDLCKEMTAKQIEEREKLVSWNQQWYGRAKSAKK